MNSGEVKLVRIGLHILEMGQPTVPRKMYSLVNLQQLESALSLSPCHSRIYVLRDPEWYNSLPDHTTSKRFLNELLSKAIVNVQDLGKSETFSMAVERFRELYEKFGDLSIPLKLLNLGCHNFKVTSTPLLRCCSLLHDVINGYR